MRHALALLVILLYFGCSKDPDPVAASEPPHKSTLNAINEAEAIIASYLNEYGQYPPTEHGQSLITTWKDVRDKQGNHLRYTLANDGLFEIRSAGLDAEFNTVDDLTDKESQARNSRAAEQAQAEQQRESLLAAEERKVLAYIDEAERILSAKIEFQERSISEFEAQLKVKEGEGLSCIHRW